jgi:hypothetical protein
MLLIVLFGAVNCENKSWLKAVMQLLNVLMFEKFNACSCAFAVISIHVRMRFTLHATQAGVLFIHINKFRHECRTVALGSHCKKTRRIWNARLWTEGLFLSEITKTWLYRERRKVLGTEQSVEDTLKIVFLEKVLRLGNKSSFLQFDHTDDSCLRCGRLWIFT